MFITQQLYQQTNVLKSKIDNKKRYKINSLDLCLEYYKNLTLEFK